MPLLLPLLCLGKHQLQEFDLLKKLLCLGKHHLQEFDLLKPKDRPSDTVLVFMHPIGGGAYLPMVSELAKCGDHVVYVNSRYRGIDAALIRRVAANRTVLMVEHNLGVVENLSDHITVLSRGEIIAEGDYRSVSGHPEVIKAYLGSERA